MANAGVTDDTTPTLSGKGDAGSVVTIKDGDTILGSTTVGPDGNWSFTPSAPLAKGPHSITTTATDAAGNTSAPSSPQTFTIDTDAPAAPTIGDLTDNVPTATGSIASGASTDDTTPTLTGKAEQGSTVEIFDTINGVTTLIGTATVDAQGNWSFTPPVALAAGAHSWTVKAVDAAGNEGPASAARPFTVAGDANSGPAAPAINNVTDNAGTVTGDIPKNGTSDDNTPTVSGTGTPGTVVTVFNGTTPVGSATVGTDGKWSVTTSALTGPGVSLSARATDAAGQTSPATGAYPYTLDTSAPAKPSFTATDNVGPSTGAIAGGSSTDDTTPTLSGTTEPGAVVVIKDGNTVLGSTTAGPDGSWSFTPKEPLANGAHSFTTTATDAAGNTSPTSDPLNFTVDTNAVVVSITKAVDNVAANTGDLADKATTNDTTPTLVGKAPANTVVTIREGNTVIGSTTADANGNWSFTTPEQSATSHTYTASATNAAGNTGTSTFTLNVDNVAPATPSGLTITDDVGSKQGPVANAGVTDDTTPTLSGKGDAGSVVTIKDGDTILGSTTVGPDGNWSFTPSAPLAKGPHSITTTATDAAGNTSAPSTAQTFTVDTTGPSQETVDPLNPATGKASLVLDKVTSDDIISAAESATTIAITGKARGDFTTGDTVTLTINSKTFTGTVAADGTFSINVPGADLVADTDTLIDATLLAHDAAGNPGTITATKDYTAKTTAPNDGKALALTIDTDANNDGLINFSEIGNTNGTAKTVINVTASFDKTKVAVGDVITFTDTATGGAVKTVTLDAAAITAGKVSTSFTSPGDGGTFSVKATIADTLGNTSPVANDTASLDLSNLNPVSPSTKQGVAIQITTDGNNDNILNTTELNGGTTAIVRVTLPTDAKAGDVLVITGTGNTAQSITLSASQVSTGNLSVTFNTPANGSKLEVTATVTDASGNTSNVATDFATINTTPVGAPTVVIATDGNNDGFINKAELGNATTVSVNTTLPNGAAVGETITVTDGTTTKTHVLVQADLDKGFVTDSFTAPANGGTFNVTATLTNNANNTSAAGTDKAVLDTSSFVDPTDSSKTGLKVTLDTDGNNDGFINGAELTSQFKATITLPGQAAAGDTVTLNASGNNPRTITLTAQHITDGKVIVSDLTPTGDGTTFKVSASISDKAGNTSPTPDATDSADIKSSAPNGGVAPTVEITTDADNDGFVNATEIGSATTFTVKGSFDKTKVMAGDKLIFTDGTTTQTVTLSGADIGNGFATTTFAKPAEGGTLSVTAKLQDSLGNATASSAADSAKLDTSAPNGEAAPTVEITTDSNNDGFVNPTELGNATTFTVKGSFDKTKVVAGDILVFTDGTLVKMVTLSAGDITNGFATTTFAKPAEGGTLQVTATVMDAAGNVASESLVDQAQLDTTGPAQETTDPLNPAVGKASLVLDAVTADNIVNSAEGAQANVAITGKARGEFTAGDVVTLTVNGKTFTGQVAADGTFSINVPGSDLLADGDKTIDASLAAKDKAGNTGTVTDTQAYTTDTTAPTTTVDIIRITDDSGVSGTDFITNDNNGLTVSATLSAALNAGEKLLYSKDNGVTWTDITASVNGTAVSLIDSTLTSTATLQMRVQDAAGNNGAADTQLVTIDTTAPSQETTDPLNPAAGKASLVLDAVTADNIVNSAEGAQANVAITGKARGEFTNGDIVTLTVNGKTFTGAVNAQGVFSINVPGSDLLADGDKTIDASLAAKDAAGNTGTVSATKLYDIDTTAPTTTVDITRITDDSGVSGTDFITNDNNGLTVSATLSAALATGEKLFYSRDNGVTWTDITGSVTGTAVSAVDSQLTSTSTIQMQVRDAAGNAGASDTQLVTIDTTAPSQETTDPLNPAAGKASLVLDAVTADNIVNSAEGAQANVAITGKARGEFTNGDIVTLTVNGKTFTGAVNAQGVFSINVPGSDLLADGDKTIDASLAAKDAAGNTGTVSASKLYDIDTTAPTTTVDITGISLDSGVGGDFITNDNNGLTISATLSAALATGEKLFYSRDNGVTWTDITGSVSGTAVSHADSTLTSTATLQMRVQDAAGNNGAADTQLVTIDTTAPSQETTDPLNPAAGKASLVLDAVTADNIVNSAEGAQANVAITGKARGEFTAGDVVTLTVNGKTFTGAVNAQGVFSINVPGSDLLADGDKTIDASLAAKDAAGNTGTVSDTQVYSTDTTAPTTTVDITAISTDSGVSTTDFITNDNNGLTISATLSAALATGEKLFYSRDNGVTWTDITGSVTGTAVSAVDSQLTSTSTIQMQVRDAAGNAGASDTQLVTIDASGSTTQPNGAAEPNTSATVSIDAISTDSGVITSDFITSDQTLSYSGTVTGFTANGAAVQLVLTNAAGTEVGRTFVTPAADGTWSWDNTGVTRDSGNYTLTATVVDAAGNRTNTAAGGQDSQVVTVDTSASQNTDHSNGSATPATDNNKDATVSITAITSDSGVSTSDFITNDQTLSYSGTVTGFTANGAAVQLVLTNAAGNEVASTFVTPTNGTWSWDNTGVTRDSGNYTLTATVVDAAGNRTNTAAGGQDSQIVTIDNDAGKNTDNGSSSATPQTDANATNASIGITTIVDATLDSKDTGTSDTDLITQDRTVAVKGTVGNFVTTGASAGDTVRVQIVNADGSIAREDFVTPDSAGNWTLNNTANTLADGVYTLKAAIVDKAGNTLKSAVDKTLVIDNSASANPANNNGPDTNNETTASVSVTAIDDGNNATGNADGSKDNGTFNNDFVTNDNTLVIKGTTANFSATGATNGDRVRVQLLDEAGTTVVAQAFVLPDSNGAWTWDRTGTQQADGKYQLHADIVDAAGNIVKAGNTQPLTIDTSATNNPNNGTGSAGTDSNATSTLALAITTIDNGGTSLDSGSSATDFITNDQTLVIQGTAVGFSNSGAQAGDQLRVQLVKADGTLVRSAFVTVDSSGNWSLDNTANTLDAGTYTIKADVMDLAGNTVKSATHALTVDVANNELVTAKFINKDTPSNDGASVDVSNTDWKVYTDGVTRGQTIFTTLGSGETITKAEISLDGGTTWTAGEVTGDLAKFFINNVFATTTTSIEYKFRTTDVAGNLSAVSSKTVTIQDLASNTSATSITTESETVLPTTTTAGTSFRGDDKKQTFTADANTITNYLVDATPSANWVNAGGGMDTLKVIGTDTTLNLNKLTTEYNLSKLQGFEVIDLKTDAAAQTVIGSGLAFASFGNSTWLTNSNLLSGYQVVIRGDAADTLVLSPGDAYDTTGWVQGAQITGAGTNVFDGVKFNVWSNAALNVQLLVEELVVVSNKFVSFDAISTDTGTSNTDLITTDTTLALSGAVSGTVSTDIVKVTVLNSSNVKVIDNVTASVTNGVWTLDNQASALPLGNYTVKTTITNAAGTVLATGQDRIVKILAANDAPVDTGLADLSTNEDTAVAITGLSVSDASNNGDNYTVTLGVTNGTLTVSGGTATISGSGTNTVTLTGTKAAVNATLAATVSFVPTGNFNGSAQLTMSTNDASLGDAKTDSDTITITVNSVNDAPVVTPSTTAFSYAENAGAIKANDTLTLSDADTANLSGATVQITSGLTTGDVLGFVNANGITGSYNAATGKLTLTGSATVAQYQAALQSVTYVNTGDNPTTTQRILSWQVDDGQSANHASNVGTSTIDVTVSNDAPTGVNDTASATEAGGAANATAGTNPTGNVVTNDTDPDNANSALTVKDIKAGTAAGAGTAVAASTTSADGTSITGSFGTLKIGANGSYVYTVDNSNATVQALNTTSTALSDVFTYTVQDSAGLSSTATITVSVNGANDAPVVANAIADTTGTEGSALSFVVPANAFSDVDNSSLTLSATLADGSALPSWLTFTASTRTFSGTPPTGAGTVSVKVTASDGSLSANDTFDIVVGAANTAPVANPTSVASTPLSSADAVEVTITDNQSAARVANGTEVTFTLKFSQAIDASSLTASDIVVDNGSLVAGSLTKVDATTWTVKATAASTGNAGLVLSIADGAYTSAGGTVGTGAHAIQAVGSTIASAGAAIDGTPAIGAVPTGWTAVSGTTPDLQTAANGNGTVNTPVTNITGASTNGGSFMDFVSTGGSTIYAEAATTTLSGLTVGQTYTYGIEWQQYTSGVFAGGQLVITVDGVSQVYTSSGLTDGWQKVLFNFVATSTSTNLTVGVNGIADATGFDTVARGTIAVDSLTASQISAEAASVGISSVNIGGTTGTDTLIGTDGNDTITLAGGGSDKVFAGAGNDVVNIDNASRSALVDPNTTMIVDGGTGINALVYTTGGTSNPDVDLTNRTAITDNDSSTTATQSKLRNFSTIDITGGTTAVNSTLKLDYAFVANISGTADNTATTGADESKMLVINGNAGDTVQLVDLSKWTQVATQSGSALASTYGSAYQFKAGSSYKQFTLNGANLFVDDTVTVSTTTATTAAAAATSQAVTIASLFEASFTDVDSAQTFKGVAITSAGTAAEVSANGKYQISTNGSTWTDLANNLSDTNAVYAAPTALIRYVSATGIVNANQQNLTVRLIDSSGLTGTSGTLSTGSAIDASVNGGSTAFSGNLVTLLQAANTAPVANPTSVTSNAISSADAVEVTITDNQSAARVANGTEVTYTLKFSQAINASSLTASDIVVNNGTIVAGSLTQVDATTWTVKATAAATGSNSLAVSLADGSYTSTGGTSGTGGTGLQAFGAAPLPGNSDVIALSGQSIGNGTNQTDRQMVALPDGGWVLTTYTNILTTADAVSLQRYSSAGIAVGSPVTAGSGGSRISSITSINSNGDFVVTWDKFITASSTEIGMQRFDANLNKIGSEVVVNTTTADLQFSSVVSKLSNGGFVVAWNSKAQDSNSTQGVYAQIFDAAGNKVGSEFALHTTIAGVQQDPSIVGLSDGSFVASWTDGFTARVNLQRFSSTGTKIGSEISISSTGNNTQPSMSLLNDGGFVVSWTQDATIGDQNIVAQRFDATGTKVGSQIAVNTTTTGQQTNTNVTTLADGSFVIAWTTGTKVMLQVFDATGTKIGSEQTYTNTAGSFSDPTLTPLPNGGFVLAMQAFNTSTSTNSVAQKVFGAVGSVSASGTTGTDTFTGGDLDDTITVSGGGSAAGGADRVLAGAGNDTVIIDQNTRNALEDITTTNMLIDGGTGVNQLVFRTGGSTLDLTNNTVRSKLRNFSSFDITGTGGTPTLVVDYDAVVNMSGASDNTATTADESKMIVVNGNSSTALKVVNLSGWSTSAATQSAAALTAIYGSAYQFKAGSTYKEFTRKGATLFVDSTIAVSTSTSTELFTGQPVSVQTLFGPSFTDVNSSQTFKGVAITNAGVSTDISAKGKYQLSTDGTTWTDVAAGLTDSTAVYAAPTALIRFVGASGVDALRPQDLSVRLIDSSGLTGTTAIDTGTIKTGSTINASVNGGATAFSGNTVTLAATNTAPVSTDADGVIGGDPLGASTVPVTTFSTSSITANGTTTFGSNSVTVSGLSGTVNTGTGFFVGDSGDETVSLAFGKPLSQVQIDLSGFGSPTAGNLEQIQVLVNGVPFALKSSYFTSWQDFDTSAAVTPQLSADGLSILHNSSQFLKGSLLIKASDVPGGNINSISLLNDLTTGNAAGTEVRFILPATSATPAQTVAQLFGGVYSDANADAMAGVVVTSAGTAANLTALGKYQFSSNNGSTWTDLAGDLTGNTSVFLAKTDLVRFVPSSTNTSSVAKQDLVVRLVDDSLVSGTFASGATVNLSSTGTGGSTAISGNTVSLGEVFNAAPVLADTSLSLSSLGQSATPANPTGAVGSLVSDLVGGVSDAQTADGKGIAITGADTTNGTLFFSTNGGTTWTAVDTSTALSDSRAFLLKADTDNRVYFKPNANFLGATNALTFRAWDQTSGTEGTFVNISAANAKGGTTAYSLTTDTVNQTVTTAVVTLTDAINGTDANQRAGFSVSYAGDVNGDGFDDVIIGEPQTILGGAFTGKGKSFVVFGNSGNVMPLDLSELESGTSTKGFVINGQTSFDYSGRAVSAAGDLNGDGLADLLIGAPGFVGDATPTVGKAFVVYGKTGGAAVNLSSLGSAGFQLTGESSASQAGFSVSTAGDVNGDGIADLIVGANRINSVGGGSYIVFGKTGNANINLSDIKAGVGGFIINGSGGETAGASVSNAGDVNGDGLADLIVGAPESDPASGTNAGRSYVIFGKTDNTAVALTDIAAGNGGFVINGEAASDRSGSAVSSAGDVNGDGLADLLIGASVGGVNDPGKGYIVFGQTSGTAVQLSALSTKGYVINGSSDFDMAGSAVSYAGDINGDGLADLLISSPFSDVSSTVDAGKVYVAYGKSNSTAIDLSSLNAGIGGFVINGQSQSDNLGGFAAGVNTAVSYAGDLNGDGYDDLIVSAVEASTTAGGATAGKTYVIYGGSQFVTGNVATGTGTSSNELVIGTSGNDTLTGGGGVDRFSAGLGNDTIVLNASDVSNLAATTGANRAYIDGGNGIDTLQVSASGVNLNLTQITNVSASAYDGSSRINDVERINLGSDTTANTLTLVANDVNDMAGFNSFNTGNGWTNTNGTPLSATVQRHQLVVDGTSADTIVSSEAWSFAGTATNAGITYNVYNSLSSNTQVLVNSAVAVNLNVGVNIADVVSSGTGFVINSQSAGDRLGFTVTNAGDVNGDGFDDVLLGAPDAVPGSATGAGKSYVVYGGSSAATVDLSALGTKGFVINGESTVNGYLGTTISAAGDINGDGLADVFMGSFNNASGKGRAYVVFGKTGNAATNLSDVAGGTGGFAIDGTTVGEFIATSVRAAGDVNGDGFADLLIGAGNADTTTNDDSGRAYVVFGKSNNTKVELSALGTQGFVIQAASAGDRLGDSVSQAGDVNGDGLSDLVLLAPNADPSTGANAGAAYVVFGKANNTALNVSSLTAGTGTQGFVINGLSANEGLNIVSNVGDVNGDGLADVIVSSANADPAAGTNAGRAYVVFGKTGGAAVNVSAVLAGLGGFAINGLQAGERVEFARYAGDINGDGLADMIVGAKNSDPITGANAGRSYVVYGKTGTSAIELSAVNSGTGGFAIVGVSGGDGLGVSASYAGDVNGDGFDDLIVGADRKDVDSTGKAYVIFGGSRYAGTVDFLGNASANTLTGSQASETFVGGDGNDTLVGAGGADVMFGGRGNDTFVLNAGNANALQSNFGAGNNATQLARIDGGTGYDTLRLSDGASLDMTRISAVNASGTDGTSRLDSIERIDLATDTASNTLTLSGRDVADKAGFNLIKTGSVSADGKTWTNVTGTALGASNAFHQLVVDGTSADNLNLTGTWTQVGTVSDGSAGNFVVLQNDATRSQVIARAALDLGLNRTISISGAVVNDTGTRTTEFGVVDLLKTEVYTDSVVEVRSFTDETRAYEGVRVDNFLGQWGSGTDEIFNGGNDLAMGFVDAAFNNVNGQTQKVILTSKVGNFTTVSFRYADVQTETGYSGLTAGTVRFFDANDMEVGSQNLLANTAGSGSARTFTWTATGASAKYFTISIPRTDGWYMDTLAFSSGAGTLPSNEVTLDNTPQLQGSLNVALSGSQVVKIFEGATEIGTAAVSGTNWTFQFGAGSTGTGTTTSTVSVGQHTYTARVMDGTTVVSSSGSFVVNVASSVAPVVLDLNRDGELSYANTVMDVNSDGVMDSTLWAGVQDGVLVWDKYHDGRVHDHTQYAFTEYGGSTDLEGLAAGFDSNHDGVFNAADVNFDEFKVWQDLNGNGVSDAGEVRSLADLGITEINLVSDGVVRTPAAGVHEAGRSTATLADGTSVLVADAGFVYHTATAAELASHAIAQGESVFKISGGMSLDLSGVTQAAKLAALDLSADSAANTVKLTLADVLGTDAAQALASGSAAHQLKLTGDINDTAVFSANEWTHTGNVVTDNGHDYAVYNAANGAAAQLLVDQHMLVSHNG